MWVIAELSAQPYTAPPLVPIGRVDAFSVAYVVDGSAFYVAGVLGLLIGICRPFNPDNSRLCARFYACQPCGCWA
jgi:1-acyl-sn-glycerol-3-phosphate acyltransferase